MKIFVANLLENFPIIDIINNTSNEFKRSITGNIFKQVSSLNSSDAVLVPHDAYYFVRNSEYLVYLDNLSKIKLIIFSDRGDFPINPKINNSVSIRVAINPHESLWGKIVVPYKVEYYNFLKIRKYQKNPNINFTGYVPTIFSPHRFIKTIKQTPKNLIVGNGAIVRNIGIYNCKKNLVNFTYTKRDSYHTIEKNKFRDEYIKNIENNDIIFSPRGDSNQSQRFYEAMSAGRLTLMPNSNMIFPFPVVKSKFESLGIIMFNLNSKYLSNIVNDRWKMIGTAKKYKELKRVFVDFIFIT